jgi:hypothetical protein
MAEAATKTLKICDPKAHLNTGSLLLHNGILHGHLVHMRSKLSACISQVNVRLCFFSACMSCALT